MEYILKEVVEDLKNPGAIVKVPCTTLPTEKQLLAECTNNIFFFINEEEKVVTLVKKTETKDEFLKLIQNEKIGIKTKKDTYRIPVGAINRLYPN